MDIEQKLAFIHKMAKLGLEHSKGPDIQHFDSGGTVLSGPSTATSGGGATNPNSGVIGTINGALGLNDKFNAGSAQITPGTNTAQLNDAYTNAQTGITNQTNLVTQTQPGVTQGLQTQGLLSQALLNQANGIGPNPAQSALNQATGQNIKQQAALAANTRGTGSNAGGVAENASRIGADTQQQAVGQAATLQAQQQLAAQQQALNLAGTQFNQGAGAVTGQSQQTQNEQNILQGANTAANNAAVGMQSNINNVNAQTSAANQNMAANTLGGLLSGAGAVAGLFAHGGMVKMDKGGNVLDANARKHIAPEHFALPGRRYPIHDMNHARNALARVSQNGSPQEKAKVKAAVHKKYPSLAKKKGVMSEKESKDSKERRKPLSSSGLPVEASSLHQNLADGGEVDSEIPSFEPTPSNSSDGPNIQATGELPADKTDFGQEIASGVKTIASVAALAKGGEVQHGYLNYRKMAMGGYMAPGSLLPQDQSGPQSFTAQWINSPQMQTAGPNIQATPQMQAGPQNLGKDVKSGAGSFKKAMGQRSANQVNTPDGSEDGTNIISGGDDLGGGEMFAYSGGLAARGGDVNPIDQSQKAVKKGDSLKNDKIPALLSEGEVVMDRETLQDKGPVGQMARAVAMHIKKRNSKK